MKAVQILESVSDEQMKKSAEVLILLGGAVLCLAMYAHHLDFPSEPYYDEVYHVPTAREYLARSPVTTETVHPPLGKLLIAASIWFFGDTSWVWRLASLGSGILLIFIVFTLARILTQNFWTALLATFFFAVEGVHITQSRIAMLNSPMVLFMFASLLALLPYLMNPKAPRSRAFFVSGVCLGLALSIRWVSLGIAGVIGPFLFKRFFEEKNQWAFLRDAFLFYFLIPLAIYTAAHSVIPLVQGRPWIDIWNSQVHMARYHLTLTEPHGYGSEWWSWPLLVRPIWYFFERKEGLVYGIFCIGNPAVYWLILVAMGYVFIQWLKRLDTLHGIVLFGFLTQWLPWAWVGRVKFFHYFYAAVPFSVIALALLTQRIWQGGRVGKWVVVGYLLLVLVLFVYWYPLYTGIPISEPYFQNHLWFKSWV